MKPQYYNFVYNFDTQQIQDETALVGDRIEIEYYNTLQYQLRQYIKKNEGHLDALAQAVKAKLKEIDSQNAQGKRKKKPTKKKATSKVHIGPKGGKYIIKAGKKVYC